MEVWVDNNSNTISTVLEYGSCYDVECGMYMYCFLSFPHVVDVSALSICIVLSVFVVVLSMCLLNVSLRSKVIHNTFVLKFI